MKRIVCGAITGLGTSMVLQGGLKEAVKSFASCTSRDVVKRISSVNWYHHLEAFDGLTVARPDAISNR